MKNLNFTCPRCGGHNLIGEKPLQWIQYNVIGLDDDGDIMFDYDRPSTMYDEDGDLELYCGECFLQIPEQEIIEQSNNDSQGVEHEKS